ncbi:hypothetical protein V474_20810 [Novosphingobium barchaimii LL02]|uniref:Uncharacterized protein n=1 Tax=Novosphingobium barchaimii LL02 TaxID=1114963 RepID=A0A0J7XE56_9SPHN|nr:hypothetical protein V474_12665 [Novosphingobium barchaimii LL02]KMS54421.1 hypothetical protein V474_20810 [Novosphingobium barchaimii LL02]
MVDFNAQAWHRRDLRSSRFKVLERISRFCCAPGAFRVFAPIAGDQVSEFEADMSVDRWISR